ncbi:MAG5150 family histidine triad lipoprotein [Mycoplasma sp. Mirounga ES2805-ORL]|uniref:MAG5150 family histidine triad lipoprotein n=1 Tax=Mycoplasma sp. Mirounga ES2805-ORL TaxID=754514 RepID=UPI00197C3B62|nr:hypothetical protein [Mycoplasma sp. Mirounga ES2805-ORL]QSF13770.1 hypothetical protein JXZ90_00505 [Mycoplasma sp. Mirounga ES2805-ORL]
MKKIKSLLLSPIILAPVAIAAGCGAQKNAENSSDKTKQLKAEYINFKNEWDSFSNKLTQSRQDFFNQYSKINDFVVNLKEFSNDVKEKDSNKNLKADAFLKNGKQKEDANKEALKVFEEWFSEGKKGTKFLNFFNNSVAIIEDAETQIDTNLVKIKTNGTELTEFSTFFETLNNKEINDSDLQRNLKKVYSFLATTIFDKDEKHDHAHGHHDEDGANHGGNLNEHTHSHAIINIIKTALHENEESIEEIEELKSFKDKFVFFNDTYQQKIKDFITENFDDNKIQSLTNFIEEAEKELMTIEDQFTNQVMKPLKNMVKILNLAEDQIFTK